MQVQVAHVKAHVAGTGHAHHRVQVGAVVVAQAACVVDDLGDLQNVLVDLADGVGVGQHQGGRVGTDRGAQGVQVHHAVGRGGDGAHLVAAHGRRGGVGAVGRVGDDDLFPGVVAAGVMVGLDEQDAGKLTVGAGGGLEGHGIHAGDAAQVLLGQGVDRLAAGDRVLGLEGMDVGELEEVGNDLVDLGVVLHGTGAQGIEAVAHAEGAAGQGVIVAGEIVLAHLGETGGRAPAEGGGDLHGGDLRGGVEVQGGLIGGEDLVAAAGLAQFKNQFHFPYASLMTATASSRSALVQYSVTHHSTPSRRRRPPRMPFFSSAQRTR